MQKVLVSLPDGLFNRMKAFIPAGKRSKIISELIAREIERRENELYQCARAVEEDEALNREMEDWNVTVGDGIDSETW